MSRKELLLLAPLLFVLACSKQPSALPVAVPEGTDLHKASRRFLIQNAKWFVVE